MQVKDITIQEWQQRYKEVNQLLSERRVVDALEHLSMMAKEAEVALYIDKLDEHLDIYKNILRYSFSDVEDPQRESIYKNLIVSLLELADELKMQHPAFAASRFEEDRERRRKQLLSALEEKAFDAQFDLLSDQVFQDVVAMGKLQANEKSFLDELLLADHVPWYTKSMFLSALMLSLQQCFDQQKFRLLFAVYNKQEDHVSQRALLALLIAYYQYDIRMPYYPLLMSMWEDYSGRPDFEKQIELIVIQFLRARDTEKLNQKLTDDLLPEVQKMTPRIMDKLGLDELLSDANEEQENPEWKTVFEDTPGLYDKLEEISNLQMEGADIFMGAFSQLKSFPFFSSLSHWFLPFHEKSDAAFGMLENESFDVPEFVSSLAKSPFLCNSDKFSFCLNMTMIPAPQKKMMTSMMFDELKMMGELGKEEELLNQSARDKTVFTQYIQDLYRFYKLNNNKDLYYNIFDQEYDFDQTLFFNKHISGTTTLRNMGEFCLEKQHFHHAIAIFKRLLLVPGYDSSELLEKIAFSYQKSKQYQMAIDYYRKAELMDTNLMWLYKNLIFCYRKTGDPHQLIAYCKKAIDMEGEDTYLLTYLGHACFDLENYEEALKYYFQVEYVSSNTRVYRPIAWCAFVLGKFEVADKYFRMILKKKKPGYFDYMNFAHVCWCSGNYDQAKELYIKTIHKGNISFQQFQNEMIQDKKHLMHFGVEEYDVHLMLDYVKIHAAL